MPREDEQNWEFEDEQDDLDTQNPDADDTQDEEEELSEELQAKLDAETAKIEAKLQEKFAADKARYGRRFGAALEELRGMGMDVAEDGKVVLRDQQTAVQKLMGIAAPAQQKQDEDPEPDMWADTERWKAWNRKQAVKEAKSEFAQELEPLKQAVAQMRQSQTQQVIPTAENAARDFLEELGLERFAELPEFSDTFAESMRTIPQEHWNNPQAVETAASLALVSLRARGLKPGNAQPRRDTREATANVHRQSAQSTGRTRPSSRAPESDVSAEERELAELSGMTVAEWRAMESPESALEHFGRSNGRQTAGRR